MMRLSTLLATVCLLALIGPSAALAQVNWPSQRDICGGYDDAEFGSGQMDAAGRLYMPCSESVHPTTGALRYDNHIGIFNHAGVKVDRVGLAFDRDGKNYRATDVAPSPDGRYLYAIRRNDLRVYRFVRQANGTYVANSQAEWRLQDFTNYNGQVTQPVGVFLATDGAGNIYMSVGRWCGLVIANCTYRGTIAKFAPDGRFITRVGTQYGGTGDGDTLGGFGGLTVTADGSRIFAADPLNSRVQRFDAVGNTYTFNRAFTSTAAGGQPSCFGDGYLAAPYDVALSAGGEVVVINTTCYNHHSLYIPTRPGLGLTRDHIELQRYAQDGALRGSVLSTSHRPLGECVRAEFNSEEAFRACGRRLCDKTNPVFRDRYGAFLESDYLNCGRVHGIGIARNGRVHLVQAMASIMPVGWADLNDRRPLGGTSALDLMAPVVTALTAPATTTERTIAIGLAAADAHGVTEMELVRDGISGGWTPYSTAFGLTLANRLGNHVITVRVRDAAGNTSAPRSVTIQRTAPAAQAPVVTGGGGAPQPVKPAKQAPTPVITRVTIPVQVFRGRSTRVRVQARGGAHQVRFSTGNGRWGAWRSIKDSRALVLPKGTGWKPVFTQVRNRDGKRSRVWFQPVFVAPRGTMWTKGTARADRIRTRGRVTHVDASNFDGKVDRITCSSRRDTVLAQPEDVVSRSCRHVTRVKMPRW